MSLTKVDWMSFRTKAGTTQIMDSLEVLFKDAPEPVRTIRRDVGWMGYEHSREICVGAMRVGLMAYGGDNQKGWTSVNITGKGCMWVDDWDAGQDAVLGLPEFEFRRFDIALDTYKGEVSHQTVIDAHRSGGFTTSGRPPSCHKIEPEDPREGKTVYVGKREQGKFLRGYEKGYELIRKFPPAVRAQVHELDGVPIGDIYRLELEQKAKSGELPDDLIENRDQYFAGAYPYLQRVLGVEPEVWSQRRERGPQDDLAACLAWIRQQCGTSLFTAMVAHHGDISAVWGKIVGNHHNKALVEAGVLLVEHQ